AGCGRKDETARESRRSPQSVEATYRERSRPCGHRGSDRRARTRAMSKQRAFWDSSALVPLCVLEAASRRAHAELRKFLPVIWWGTSIEIHSAIARGHRLGQLNDREKKKALVHL